MQSICRKKFQIHYRTVGTFIDLLSHPQPNPSELKYLNHAQCSVPGGVPACSGAQRGFAVKINAFRNETSRCLFTVVRFSENIANEFA